MNKTVNIIESLWHVGLEISLRYTISSRLRKGLNHYTEMLFGDYTLPMFLKVFSANYLQHQFKKLEFLGKGLGNW